MRSSAGAVTTPDIAPATVAVAVQASSEISPARRNRRYIKPWSCVAHGVLNTVALVSVVEGESMEEASKRRHWDTSSEHNRHALHVVL